MIVMFHVFQDLCQCFTDSVSLTLTKSRLILEALLYLFYTELSLFDIMRMRTLNHTQPQKCQG